MTDRRNPLTARVAVNRLWQQMFGVGIVKTAEDFGSQGEVPSHPRLLDWLAVELQDSQWDLKHMLRLMVNTRTFRQNSAWRDDLDDPENRLLARGGSYRLDAEVMRDIGLWASGLLDPHMGGEGVKPYQPGGMWKALAHPASNTKQYVQDQGRKLYRRSLYVYWKRTSPYPSMLIFDAMAREVCNSRRISTNTPLQALVTLNDSVYVEASVNFAQRMMNYKGGIEDQIIYGYKLMMNRSIDQRKLEVLINLFQDLNKEELVRQASFQPGNTNQKRNEKSMIVIANTMLNLDEFLMKN